MNDEPDDEFECSLRSIPRAQLSNEARDRHRRLLMSLPLDPPRPHRPRNFALASLGAAGVAAAVVTVIALSANPGTPPVTPQAGGGTSYPRENTIALAGYTLVLPAGYRAGAAETNCTSELHLGAGEQQRLITTPAGGCPLLVTSVRAELPSGTRYSAPDTACKNLDGEIKPGYIGGIAVRAEGDWEVYLRAKLPDNSTVYVTVDLLAATAASSCNTLTTEVAQLAKGLEVTKGP